MQCSPAIASWRPTAAAEMRTGGTGAVNDPPWLVCATGLQHLFGVTLGQVRLSKVSGPKKLDFRAWSFPSISQLWEWLCSLCPRTQNPQPMKQSACFILVFFKDHVGSICRLQLVLTCSCLCVFPKFETGGTTGIRCQDLVPVKPKKVGPQRDFCIGTGFETTLDACFRASGSNLPSHSTSSRKPAGVPWPPRSSRGSGAQSARSAGLRSAMLELRVGSGQQSQHSDQCRSVIGGMRTSSKLFWSRTGRRRCFS